MFFQALWTAFLKQEMLCKVRQFQNTSNLSTYPRFDLQKGAFLPVAMQAAGGNHPLQLFANGIFAIF